MCVIKYAYAMYVYNIIKFISLYRSVYYDKVYSNIVFAMVY